MILGSGVKNAFQTISRHLAIFASSPPPRIGKWWNFTLWGDPTKICFIKFPDTWLSPPQSPHICIGLWPCIGMHWGDPSPESYKRGHFQAYQFSWSSALDECRSSVHTDERYSSWKERTSTAFIHHMSTVDGVGPRDLHSISGRWHLTCCQHRRPSSGRSWLHRFRLLAASQPRLLLLHLPNHLGVIGILNY